MENYTLVLSEHSGILHTCALMAQHCTQNHWYLAGLLMMWPYLVRTGVAVDTEDCAGTGVDLCVGCVDENEVFPGDGGGEGGRPVTGGRRGAGFSRWGCLNQAAPPLSLLSYV